MSLPPWSRLAHPLLRAPADGRGAGVPTVSDRYRALADAGAIGADPAQEEVVSRLDALAASLAGRKPGTLARLFGARETVPRGLYIWGPVGRGKTMLMDLFFDDVSVERKRRVHFNEFMADVHARVHAFKQKADGDPIGPVARDLAAEATLLCFDEFMVNNIADAMILGRLFSALFKDGVVVVATSNVEPDRLYAGGINRELFLPFIDLFKERLEVVRLEARTDFRLEKLAGEPVYLVPAGPASRSALDRIFTSLSRSARGAPAKLMVTGHPVEVPQAAGGVARFAFADLCSKPLGPSDYMAVAHRYHTVIIDDIPVMNRERRDEALRFVALIDTLYDRRVKLVASAAAQPTELYRTRPDGGDALFEFERTISRLIEMRSEAYLALPHGEAAPDASGSSS
ncbi:MAG: cell division protein ZapE [Alphaproteobacteria bacterium]|nr:cell division protein ZapE [Alphaproteobacteria bacterium]